MKKNIIKKNSQKKVIVEQQVEQGDAETQYRLGLRYAKGEGVPRDAAEAVKMFRLAAKDEHTMSMVALGLCHQDGFGVEANEPEAVKWFERAIVLENELAETLLCCLIYNKVRKTQDLADFLGIPCTSAQ